MDHQDIARQTQVEQEMLRLLMEGLRVTAGWQVQGSDASRKLSTLRFVAQSFRRHLERLLGLEEHEGYMDLVLASAPRLGRRAAALGAQHDQFRTEVRQITDRLEQLPATDATGLDAACAELLLLLGKIEEHNRKEIDLLHEAFQGEEGGEGG
jgi:hypothetical protein